MAAANTPWSFCSEKGLPPFVAQLGHCCPLAPWFTMNMEVGASASSGKWKAPPCPKAWFGLSLGPPSLEACATCAPRRESGSSGSMPAHCWEPMDSLSPCWPLWWPSETTRDGPDIGRVPPCYSRPGVNGSTPSVAASPFAILNRSTRRRWCNSRTGLETDSVDTVDTWKLEGLRWFIDVYSNP